MTDSIVRGSCLCSKVQFELTLPLKFCVHCHCSLCRRSHGAGFVTWTGVPIERFRITSGEASLTRYKATPSGSRRFCSTCGSSLFFQAERWPGEVHIAVANLLDTVPLSPQAHVFFNDRAEWMHVADDLPRLGGETGVAPLDPPPSS